MLATQTITLALTLMTFNVRLGVADDGANSWPNRRAMLLDYVQRVSPDLLGIQEAYDFQVQAIDTVLADHGRVGVGREDGKAKGEWCAIYYRKGRFDLKASGTQWLSDTPDVPNSMSWGNRITRIVTWARLHDKKAKRDLVVLNTHWDHQSQPSRERSAQFVLDLMDRVASETPVVVMGDFNAGPANPAIKTLLGSPRLFDTFGALHPQAAAPATFHGFTGKAEGEMIDLILASPDFRALAAQVDGFNEEGRYPSDHFPVLATVEWKS